MSNQLYKVKLAPGFNARGRNRAGLSFQKGQTQILELNKEQLAALEEDVWITVEKADKDAVATAPGESAPETTGDGSEGGSGDDVQTDPYEGKKLTELKEMAAAEGLDAEKLRSKQEVIDLIEASKNDGSDEGESDDDEEVEVSEDMPLDELKTIAEEQGVENLDTYTDENKADLVKAIEEASAQTEE